MVKGGQPGNKNATKGKLWREAIDRAVKMDRGALDRAARALLDSAAAGDIQAIKELGNRLDGRPQQAVEIAYSVSVADALKAARERTGRI